MPCHGESDACAASDGGDDMSCDGGTVAASVRDAAFRALQSSDSIRSRLVHTDSTAEDFMRGSTSGMLTTLQSYGYSFAPTNA